MGWIWARYWGRWSAYCWIWCRWIDLNEASLAAAWSPVLNGLLPLDAAAAADEEAVGAEEAAGKGLKKDEVGSIFAAAEGGVPPA